MNDEEVGRQKERAVAKAAAQLKEHFDSYVILACYSMDDARTGRVSEWFGNIFSVIGMADIFKETARGRARADQDDNR